MVYIVPVIALYYCYCHRLFTEPQIIDDITIMVNIMLNIHSFCLNYK